jgi:mannan endo-1,4-beta-mannosidase
MSLKNGVRRMRITPLLPAAALALCLSAGTSAAQTADPDATAGAKAVLAYIRRLSEKGDRKVLSGQFLDFEPNATLALPEAIHGSSGKWPAFVGVDYMDFRDQRVEYEVADRLATEYWKAGGLVEVSVHMTDPANPKGGGLRDHGVRLGDLLASGSAANAAWLAELDTIAAGLGRLQDAGVVVLWRPFHEMNGGWFWWGAKPPKDFIALWRQVFGYLTEVKHLHNLIWVYSPYYPGDGYVDMVGLDAYTDYIDQRHIKGFDGLLKLDKPAGFAEFGPHDSSNPTGDYDYTRFNQGLAASFPQAVFFMAWNNKWSPATNLRVREFYNDPSIVTRDDIPPGLGR